MTAVSPPAMPTVDAIWAAIEAEPRDEWDGYGVSASELGKPCDRSLWYNLRWASPAEKIKGRTLRIFERGNWEEGRILRDLRMAGVEVDDVDPRTNKQWRFATANGWLRGKADGLILRGVVEAPKARHALEIKSLKASDFRAILKHGLLKAKPEHWHQLHAGMAGLSVERGLYVGRNKDTEELLTERIRIDHEEAIRQNARVQRLVEDHDGPMRITDDPANFACRFCRHGSVCHEGLTARRHCRSCIHFAFGSDGNGHCVRFDEPRRPDAQRAGERCPAHLFLPSLVAGEQTDADPDAETITYRMADGSEWTDGDDKSPETPEQAGPDVGDGDNM